MAHTTRLCFSPIDTCALVAHNLRLDSRSIPKSYKWRQPDFPSKRVQPARKPPPSPHFESLGHLCRQRLPNSATIPQSTYFLILGMLLSYRIHGLAEDVGRHHLDPVESAIPLALAGLFEAVLDARHHLLANIRSQEVDFGDGKVDLLNHHIAFFQSKAVAALWHLVHFENQVFEQLGLLSVGSVVAHRDVSRGRSGVESQGFQVQVEKSEVWSVV
ncbi:hypothetical protein HDK90DRAFT_94456 [Phyllosticta capitalensis]|uniref:Uncharacterized protein n=1 Tax=Phyllosticta capitalensis TaxID=121624 RepID=A0ABR1YDR9_9PEZI